MLREINVLYVRFIIADIDDVLDSPSATRTVLTAILVARFRGSGKNTTRNDAVVEDSHRSCVMSASYQWSVATMSTQYGQALDLSRVGKF